jgi:hypothetical protein
MMREAITMPDFEGKLNITKDGQVTIMLDGDAGKVGIGTTSPEGKLHVNCKRVLQSKYSLSART